MEIVTSMCDQTGQTQQPHDPRLFLSAPDFLFVSTKLAKKFPHLMESTLVLSFYSHVPGELSRKWQRSSHLQLVRNADGMNQGNDEGQDGPGEPQWRDTIPEWAFTLLRSLRNLRRAGVVAALLSSLQHFAAFPFIVHRLFIRFMQPVTLTGIVLFFYLVASDPIYVSLFFGLLAMAGGAALGCWFRKRYLLSTSSSGSAVLPTTVATSVTGTAAAAAAGITADIAVTGVDTGPVRSSSSSGHQLQPCSVASIETAHISGVASFTNPL